MKLNQIQNIEQIIIIFCTVKANSFISKSENTLNIGKGYGA